jgi:hypothetical protein
VLNLLSDLVEVPVSHDPERALEIALLKARPTTSSKAVSESQPKAAEQPTPKPVENPKSEPEPKPKITKPAKVGSFDGSVWPEVLKALKQQYNTLYGIVRMAQPDFSEDGVLKLSFAFGFHQKRLNENSNRQRLVDIIYNLTGQKVEVECVVDKSAQPPKITVEVDKTSVTTEEKSAETDLTAISNIFGNAELLES